MSERSANKRLKQKRARSSVVGVVDWYTSTKLHSSEHQIFTLRYILFQRNRRIYFCWDVLFCTRTHAYALCFWIWCFHDGNVPNFLLFFKDILLPGSDFRICLKNIRPKNNKNIRTKSNCIFLVANIAEVLSLVSYLFEKLKALQETPWIRDLNERAII